LRVGWAKNLCTAKGADEGTSTQECQQKQTNKRTAYHLQEELCAGHEVPQRLVVDEPVLDRLPDGDFARLSGAELGIL